MRAFENRNVRWAAISLLAFFLGMAVMNGKATDSAISQVRGDCHWTVRNELQRQRHMLTSQAETGIARP